MRSLIILEVEHGEDTDALQLAINNMVVLGAIPNLYPEGISVKDWSVRVDLPACFVLDSVSAPTNKES